MDSFSYYYVALALVAAALASVAIWSRRRPRWKSASVVLLAGTLVLGYFSYRDLLSRPKPLDLTAGHLAEARVISAALREDEAIYLWLDIDKTPRFYYMPWDTRLAQQLQDVMRETRRSGHEIAIRPPEEGEGEDTGANGDNPHVDTFYAVPPPILLPEKDLQIMRGRDR